MDLFGNEGNVDTGEGRSLLAVGRAAAWIAVVLLFLGLPASAVTFVEAARESPRSILGLTGFVVAWLAFAAVPLALIGSLVGLRLRTRAAPPLWAPAIMVAVGAGVLSWARGGWLLVPAGVLVLSSVLFEGWSRLTPDVRPARSARSVAADL